MPVGEREREKERKAMKNFFVNRLCKEPNHIPLRCDEIEKGLELEMRKFIEEHVTEAMIRKCPRCTQVCETYCFERKSLFPFFLISRDSIKSKVVIK